jgi:hypothetical protein
MGRQRLVFFRKIDDIIRAGSAGKCRAQLTGHQGGADRRRAAVENGGGFRRQLVRRVAAHIVQNLSRATAERARFRHLSNQLGAIGRSAQRIDLQPCLILYEVGDGAGAAWRHAPNGGIHPRSHIAFIQ